MPVDYHIRIWGWPWGRAEARPYEALGCDEEGIWRAQHAAPLQRLRQRRTELAGGEGAEAGGKFGGGQVALAVEAAEKIVGRLFSFLGIAFHAAGDQVAVGIAPQPRLRHDVVQALDCRRGPAQTVEALAALARVNGFSQRLAVQKICLLDAHWRLGARAFFLGGGPAFDAIQPYAANLAGKPHLHYVPQFAALDHAQSTVRDEAAHRLAH